MRQFTGLTITLLLLLLSAACSNKKVHPYTDEKFPPTPASQEIRLYVSSVERPHIGLALIESFQASDTGVETRRRQLNDLSNRARKLGADAIINIRQRNTRVRGYVQDEKVPFPAIMQGEYDRYVLRGVAIRYTDGGEWEEETLTPAEIDIPAESESLEEIPEVEPVEDRRDEEPVNHMRPRPIGPPSPL